MDSKISLNLIKNWKSLCSDIDFTDVAPLLIQNRIILVDEYQKIVSESKETRTESLLLLLLKKGEDIMLKFGDCLERDYSWLAEKVKEGYFEESKDEVDASPINRSIFDRETETDIYTEDEKSANDTCDDCHSLNNVNRNNKLNNSLNNKPSNLGRRKILKNRVKSKLKPKLPKTEALISSTTEMLKPVLNEEVTDEAITLVRKSPLVSRSWTTIAHGLGLTDRVNEIRYKVVLHGEDLSMCLVYLIKDWREMFPKLATLSKLIEVLRSEGFNEVGDKLSEILHRKT